MKVKVQGELRRRTYVGIGPFKREKWRRERFEWDYTVGVDPLGEHTEAVPDLEFSGEIVGGRFFLMSFVRSQRFMICDVDMEVKRTIPFNILSVSGVEVSGRVLFTPGT